MVKLKKTPLLDDLFPKLDSLSFCALHIQYYSEKAEIYTFT